MFFKFNIFAHCPHRNGDNEHTQFGNLYVDLVIRGQPTHRNDNKMLFKNAIKPIAYLGWAWGHGGQRHPTPAK